MTDIELWPSLTHFRPVNLLTKNPLNPHYPNYFLV
jgi:hypothetical protein